MNDSGRRATRTFLQAIPPALLLALWAAFAPPTLQMSPTQAAALMAFLVAVTSWAQNVLEQQGVTATTVVPR